MLSVLSRSETLCNGERFMQLLQFLHMYELLMLRPLQLLHDSKVTRGGNLSVG